MRVWGAVTNYWRARGSFAVSPDTVWYDLSTFLPALRTRSWTLDQMVRDIQYACLEAPSGIAGTGMSGQIDIQSILDAIARARNQFVLDAILPFSVIEVIASPPPPQGTAEFSSSVVYVHRAAWQDTFAGIWTNLWREDAWSADHSLPLWTTTPTMPVAYSESELSPLKLQLIPPPLNEGILESVVVQSLSVDITNPNSTFNIPDEWVHAVKYAALSDIFSSESQNKDTLRSQYADMRYKQAVDLVKSARSVTRVLLNNTPLAIDSLAAIDAGLPRWRNRPGRPSCAGILYDFIVPAPVPDRTYGVSVDVVQSAPIPLLGNQYIEIGLEDMPRLIDYVTHIMTFKCGGNDFKSTFPQYDSYMEDAGKRGGINKAKIRYTRALLGQPAKEESDRPDRIIPEAKSA